MVTDVLEVSAGWLDADLSCGGLRRRFRTVGVLSGILASFFSPDATPH